MIVFSFSYKLIFNLSTYSIFFSFKNIQTLTTPFTSTVITLIKAPSHLIWISTDKFLTAISALSPDSHPHRVFTAHIVASAIFWKRMSDHVLCSNCIIILHSLRLKAKVLTLTFQVLSSSVICISIYSAPNTLTFLLFFKHGKHTSVSRLSPLLFSLPGAACL